MYKYIKRSFLLIWDFIHSSTDCQTCFRNVRFPTHSCKNSSGEGVRDARRNVVVGSARKAIVKRVTR